MILNNKVAFVTGGSRGIGKIKFFDPEKNQSYIPYVVETSIGLDRMFLSVLSHAFCKEKLENGESRLVLKIPAFLAPIKAAILPLTKKDGMPEKARAIMKSLLINFNCLYEEKDSIGKRYRRRCNYSFNTIYNWTWDNIYHILF